MKIKTVLLLATLVLTTSSLTPGHAQVTLSGISVYDSGSDGSWLRSDNWNTRGPDPAWNVYLFTGSTNSPVFLNGGNTDVSLNPNIGLSPGTNVIHFACEIGLGIHGFVGMNFYFNDDLQTNRISVVVPNDGTSSFSVVGSSITTYGNSDGAQPGSGSDTFTFEGWTAQLTDFHMDLPSPDLVGVFSIGSDGGPDAVGSFTLVVTPGAPQLNIEVSEVRLCWMSETNKMYQLQYRSIETTNVWVNLQTPVAGTGTNLCLTDAITVPQRSYRLLTLP